MSSCGGASCITSSTCKSRRQLPNEYNSQHDAFSQLASKNQCTRCSVRACIEERRLALWSKRDVNRVWGQGNVRHRDLYIGPMFVLVSMSCLESIYGPLSATAPYRYQNKGIDTRYAHIQDIIYMSIQWTLATKQCHCDCHKPSASVHDPHLSTPPPAQHVMPPLKPRAPWTRTRRPKTPPTLRAPQDGAQQPGSRHCRGQCRRGSTPARAFDAEERPR